MNKTIYIVTIMLAVICPLHATDGYWQKLVIDTTSVHSVKSIAIDYWQNIFVGTKQGEIFRSVDGGETWKLLHKYSDRHPNVVYQVTAIAILPNGHILACQPNDGLYFSDDHGDHWAMVGLEDYFARCMAVHPDGRVYAGSADPNGLFASHDEGNTWAIVPYQNPPFHRAYPVSGVAIGSNYRIYFIVNGVPCVSVNESPYSYLADANLKGSSIFVSKDQTIFVGSDGNKISFCNEISAHFTAVTLSGANATVTCFGEDRRGGVYAGTAGNGLWRSLDHGYNWVKEALDDTTINQLTIDSSGVVYAACQSGVFKRMQKPLKVRDKVYVSQPSCTLFPAYPNPFNSSITIEFQSAGDYITVDIIDINGRVVATPCEHQYRKGSARVYWHGQDSKGAPVASGVYFIALRSSEAGTKIALQKVIMVK